MKLKTKKIMDYSQISKKDKQFVDGFSRFVNGGMCSAKETGRALAADHRYLVNEKGKVMFYFMEALAADWRKGRYDQRNEWACRLAAVAMDALEAQGLYYKTLENEAY